MKRVKLKRSNGYSSSNNDVEFELTCSYSFIKIKSIIIDTLCDKEKIKDWVNGLQQSNVSITAKYEGNGLPSKDVTHYILGDLTGQHQIPVFNYDDWYLPTENVRNITGKNFYKSLKLTLNTNYNYFEVTIVYEDSPGVKLLSQDSYRYGY